MNEQPKPYVPSEEEYKKAEDMAFDNSNHSELRKISEEWAERNKEQIVEKLKDIIREDKLTEEFINRVMHECRKIVELHAMPKFGQTSEFKYEYSHGNPNGPKLEGYRAEQIMRSIFGIDLINYDHLKEIK